MSQVIYGDCLVEMAKMGPNSIDAIVTDPPYGLEFMGKEWDRLLVKDRHINYPSCRHSHGPNEYRGNLQAQEWHYAWAVEALRVAKPGAHLLAFGGCRTHHRLMCAIEDAGWEIRDCLMWVYGSGFPKSHNLKGKKSGWGTALKPAWEPIILARKPLDGTVAENVQKWGTGSINVDGCRVEGIPWKQTEACNISSKGKKGGAWSHPDFESKRAGFIQSCHPAGRWPANLIHDGSDEVLAGFPWTRGGGPSGSAARFFYCAKASRAEREMGLEGMEERTFQSGCGGDMPIDDDGKERDRFKVKAKNHHPTVKPLALMRYLCRLVTPPNGLILDPFMGSGTTGVAAKAEGFRFVGIDNNLEYCKIAKARIGAGLFKDSS